jgi:hypothetical protein
VLRGAGLVRGKCAGRGFPSQYCSRSRTTVNL